ncbi:MAG: hypothetical protein V1494_08440 [Candidatus Diapherotrites archaeon]
MMKAFLAVLILTALFFSGCPIDDRQILYKEIPNAFVSKECESVKDDACALFACTIESCWCDDGSFPSPVLKEGSGIIADDSGAVSAAEAYVQASGSDYSDVRNAAKISEVFWNVFAFNASGDEKVFTVAVDGTIIATVCGV